MLSIQDLGSGTLEQNWGISGTISGLLKEDQCLVSQKEKVVNIDIFYVFPVVVRPLLYCVSPRCERTPERSQATSRQHNSLEHQLQYL